MKIKIDKQPKRLFFSTTMPWLGVLCLCCVLYTGIVLDYWYFLFMIFVPLPFLRHKIRWQEILLCIGIIMITLLWIFLLPNFSLINLINKRPQWIRKSMIGFFNKHYDEETSSFIQLILLNIKSSKIWFFYKQGIDLGIVWLFGVSGFHMSLLKRVIKLIFKKKEKIGWYVNIVLIGFFVWILNIAYGCLRVWLKIIFDRVLYKTKIKNFDKLGFIGLLIAFLNPSCYVSYGFVLSFLICIVACWVNRFEFNNKIISYLMLNLLSFLVSIPFVIDMNNKIAVLTFVNLLWANYVFAFLYLYFLLFSWMPFMAIVHRGLIIATYVLIGNISFNNIFIYSNKWPVWAKTLYFGGIVGLNEVVYLIVKNNKI